MLNTIDLSKVLNKEHEQKWVALSKDNKKVIAYDANLLALDRKVQGQNVTFMKVPASDVYLTF